jgi:hypothetical protein
VKCTISLLKTKLIAAKWDEKKREVRLSVLVVVVVVVVVVVSPDFTICSQFIPLTNRIQCERPDGKGSIIYATFVQKLNTKKSRKLCSILE